MLGLGTWIFDLDTMVYSGEGLVTISDDNGSYKFVAQTPDKQKTYNIAVRSASENGNTLDVIFGVSQLAGKDINASITFDGDTAEGFVKIPFIGKIKLKNGRRAAE
ncbi:MAG: hypothetical protein K5756_09085 [Clostridiales bacterium]|nr:hypothetical protein [Clostridiales bacterium]